MNENKILKENNCFAVCIHEKKIVYTVVEQKKSEVSLNIYMYI